ncbi:hypothetical protein PG987_012827 [Apiospora arundinis]
MDPMDPDEWNEDAAAMAEAMGFSSFGGQNHPSKRRKYNARADAAFVVADGDESTLALHYDAGSGSNNTPLGERRQPKKQKTNTDEIDLDDNDNDGDQDAEGDGDGQNAAGDNVDAQAPAAQYLDPSQPIPDQVQSEIDAIVGDHGLPKKPVVSAVPAKRGGPAQSGSRHHGGGGRGGDRESGQPWWDDYYDPAFNTNPWEKVEKKLGMEPRGTWLSYDESKTKWATIKSQLPSSSTPTEAAATTTATEAVAQTA